MNETHAVFGLDAEGKKFRVSEDLTWNQAQREWTRLDDLRRAGYLPHVRFFEVRSTDDPRYADLTTNMKLLACVLTTRGFKNEKDAAHAAWKHAMGDRFHVRPRYRGDRYADAPGQKTGVQGRGGWFYYPNGVTAAQGKDDLVRVAKARGLYAKGCDGRFYVFDCLVADRPTVERRRDPSLLRVAS